jgi:hypothetical protein
VIEDLREPQLCTPAAGSILEKAGKVSEDLGWGRRTISSAAHCCPLTLTHPLLASTPAHPFPVAPPPIPSSGGLKHKQAPVFTSCHSGSRQARNWNQDCLDWGLDRTGRSHAQQGIQGTLSEQAGVATGSGGATWGWDNHMTHPERTPWKSQNLAPDFIEKEIRAQTAGGLSTFRQD